MYPSKIKIKNWKIIDFLRSRHAIMPMTLDEFIKIISVTRIIPWQNT